MSIEEEPHVCIATRDGNAHVIPVACIQRIIDGDLPFTEIEGHDEVIRAILSDWLLYLEEQK